MGNAKIITQALCAIIVLSLAATAACGTRSIDNQGVSRMPEKSIEQVLRENTDRLMSLSGVVGTAQGQRSGKPCIYVYVTESSPALLKHIPSEIDGYQVEIQVSGVFQAPPFSR